MTNEETKELLEITMDLARLHGSLEILATRGDEDIDDEVDTEADAVCAIKARVLTLLVNSIWGVSLTKADGCCPCKETV